MEDREQKNQVFGMNAGQAAQQGYQVQSQMERAKTEFGIDIPVEEIPLPSKGCTYGGVLSGAETVQIRAMTTREEDILTSKALIKNGTVISELIDSCLINKDVKSRGLLVGDRTALLVAIRATGYGTDYEANLTCSHCDHKFEWNFDLGALEIMPIKIAPVKAGTNEFAFTLPSGKNITFKFMTGTDEETAIIAKESLKKLGTKIENNVSTSLQTLLLSIDGDYDRKRVNEFVRMMPVKDSKALRAYIRENEPGIKLEQMVRCPECDSEEEVQIPMGPQFLWPQT